MDSVSDVRSDSRSDIGYAPSEASRITSSYQRVNLVTEAQACLPSLSSAFSLEGIETHGPSTPSLRQQRPTLADAGAVSTSCKDALDVLDDPTYTDTVRSTDSAASLLRRSLSVPPQYTYRPTTHKHAREVFEDFIIPDSGSQPGSKSGSVTSDTPWRQTMDDLLENPAYVDSLQSTSSGTVLLARQAASIARAGGSRRLMTWDEHPEDKGSVAGVSTITVHKEHHKYVKNLLLLSASFLCVFTAYMSLRNLQSSIIQDPALALYGLSVLYASFFVGSIFASTIVQRLRPKKTMCLCMLALLSYNAANFYPSFYTLIPVSALVGFAIGNLWTAHATYLTNIAISYADFTGKDMPNTLSRFNGIFFMFFQVSQILGGVISSTVLMSEPENQESKFPANWTLNGSGDNQSLAVDEFSLVTSGPQSKDSLLLPRPCGRYYCHDLSIVSVVKIDRDVLYTLLGTYLGFMLIGIIILFVFLDQLEGVMKRSHSCLKDQLSSTFRWFADWRVACLLGMMFYSMLQMSFMFGEFTKAYVTCAVGVQNVGYAMICLSACSSISAYVSGKLIQYVGRTMLFVMAGILHFSLLIVMLLWEPSLDTLPVLFVLTAVWGVGDGIWFTQVISLFGVIFLENREAAFAGLKMCQSLSACVMFLTAKYICTAMKIYILLGLLVVTLVTYLIMELRLRLRGPPEKVNMPANV